MPTLFRRSAAVLVAAGLLILTFGALAPAGAAPLPPLVTDYAAYPDTPQALLTPGCDSSGLSGVSFTALGVTAPSLAGLPALAEGDTVRFAWTGVSAACVGSAVSLVVKDSPAPFFDPTADQPVPPGGYNVTTATAGPGFVDLVLPSLFSSGHACAYQLDAVVGVPLTKVGPSGSFYSETLRGDGRRTTLVSARNGAYGTCALVTTTTSTTQPTTSTTGATTTTGPVTSTTPTTGPASSATPTTTAAGSTRTLAATGRTSSPVAALGMSLVLLGAGALFAQRLRRTR